MPTLGAGLMAAGFGPFGLATPASGTAQPTGPAGCRYINPATRDFQQDPVTRQLAQMPGTRQRVLLALITLQGSSTSQPIWGVRFPSRMTPTFELECDAAVRYALRQLIQTEQAIRIDSITVERGQSGRARITVSYTDTTTGEPDAVTI